MTAQIKHIHLPVRTAFLKAGFLILFLISFGFAQAQYQCTQTLREAEKLYENGLIEEIPEMLSGCLNKGFTREEKIRAYKLIINAHLFNENLNQASHTMLEFLRFHPEYEPMEAADPAEFINLYDKFETLPSLALGITGGISITDVNVIKRYTVNSTSESQYEYQSPGFHFGLRFSKSVYQNLDINADLAFARYTYNYSETTLGFASISMQEQQNHLILPVSASYFYPIKKWHPYVSLGISANYLFGATGTPERTYTDNAHQSVSGTDIDFTEQRKEITASLFGELGVRYKVQRGYFFASARYYRGLVNQTNEDMRNDNPDLVYQYYYIDDDIRLNNFSFSVGYMYLLYKPQRKE